MTEDTGNIHPTEVDKHQEKVREEKGTQGAEVKPEDKSGVEVDGPTFSDQGEPV